MVFLRPVKHVFGTSMAEGKNVGETGVEVECACSSEA
jgi:hypothetical protein